MDRCVIVSLEVVLEVGYWMLGGEVERGGKVGSRRVLG